MPPIEIRPFKRSDRVQLAALVNAHVETVLPGVSLSVNTVMSQLEREPGEYVVDPWAVERATFVAVERDRVVAAAHLVRYGTSAAVGPPYRGAAELRWLVCWPPHLALAGAPLAAACVAQMAAWDATRMYADGSLPAPAVYGVPDCWPHVRGIYEQAGFAPRDEEVLFVADVADLPRVAPAGAPLDRLAVRRKLGDAGVVFAATLDGEGAGFVELQADLTQGGLLSRLGGWAELWNLEVEEPFRRRGIGTQLVAHAADWLRLGRVERVLDVCGADDTGYAAFLHACGWRELTRIARGWERA